jgi:hypothetical protein
MRLRPGIHTLAAWQNEWIKRGIALGATEAREWDEHRQGG